MSLINQVLTDLDKRRADDADDLRLRGRVRAVAAPRQPVTRRVAMWLIVSLGVAVGAFLWFNNPDFKTRLASLVAPLNEPGTAPMRTAGAPASAADAAQSVAAQSVAAQVEAALMVPVFQLSDQLTLLPAVMKTTAAPTAVDEAAAEPRARTGRSATPKAAAVVNERSKPGPAQAKQAQTQPAQQRKVAATAGDTRADAPAAKDQPAPAPDPSASASSDASLPVSAPPLEEVVIPKDVALRQIDKQNRQLTAYERAENAFREGVANLRRGQMAAAEARFRAAIAEDRSHDAAQQALVGMLIDAGRFADAEAVLAESLGLNPRQPKQAMILARLQVERGALPQAIETLQAGRPYAGNDAAYHSLLAAVLQRAKRHQEAVSEYRQALALTPRNALWLMGLGISLRALGDNAQAHQAFRSAAALATLEPRLQAFVEQQRRDLEPVVN